MVPFVVYIYPMIIIIVCHVTCVRRHDRLKETIVQSLYVKQERARVHFVGASYFSLLILFPFIWCLLVLMTSSMTVEQIMTPYPTKGEGPWCSVC